MLRRHFGSQLLIALLLLIQQQQFTVEAATEATTSSPSSTSSGRSPPPRIRLNKCCHLGEHLNATTRGCIAGNSEHWLPLVYLIQQQRLFTPSGGSPRFMQFSPNSLPAGCDNSELELVHSRQGNLVLFSNGSLYVRERALLVEPRGYCVDREVALVCQQTANANANRELNLTAPLITEPPLLRLRKCCGPVGIYDASAKKCIQQGDGQLKLTPQLDSSDYQTLYGWPECNSNNNNSNSNWNASYGIAGDWSEAQLNRTSGDLKLPHKHLSSEQYCLEHSEGQQVKIIACAEHFQQLEGKLGGSASSTEENGIQRAVLNVGIVISIVFLALTLVAGYLLPAAVHHALHWRCQIYYVFCLLVGELLLAIEQLDSNLEPGSGLCLLLALGMQFFFLAAFFWLNTMCFNIWWTFRDFRPSSLERNQETLRLRLYSSYAWGVPLLICAVAASVDQLAETTLLRPGFGQPYCWFDNRNLAIFAYFYAPIGLLLCANIALFISTTHQLTCGLWKRDDVKSTTEKSALGKVCLKLVVVMGVTWIADIVSWLVGGPHGAWLATDLINALQGVFIFIVVGCQPQVWSACRRLCCPRLRHDITNTTNGVQHSSSSQGLPSMAGGTEFTTQQTNCSSVNVTAVANSAQSDARVDVDSGGGSSSGTSADSSAALNDGATTATTTTTTIAAAPKKIPMETVC